MRSQPVQMLQSIGVILDGLDPATVGAGERLDCARKARRLASRLTAVAGLLPADADAVRAAPRPGRAKEDARVSGSRFVQSPGASRPAFPAHAWVSVY